jgi:hypothetical protein
VWTLYMLLYFMLPYMFRPVLGHHQRNKEWDERTYSTQWLRYQYNYLLKIPEEKSLGRSRVDGWIMLKIDFRKIWTDLSWFNIKFSGRILGTRYSTFVFHKIWQFLDRLELDTSTLIDQRWSWCRGSDEAHPSCTHTRARAHTNSWEGFYHGLS